MRFRKLLLLILSLSLLSPALSPAQGTSSPPTSMRSFGLEPGRSYSAETVYKLLELFSSTGQDAVKAAFDQGYKAGLLSAAPSAAYWESIAKEYQDTAKAQARGPTWGTVAIGTGGGFIVGAAAAFLAALIWAH